MTTLNRMYLAHLSRATLLNSGTEVWGLEVRTTVAYRAALHGTFCKCKIGKYSCFVFVTLYLAYTNKH